MMSNPSHSDGTLDVLASSPRPIDRLLRPLRTFFRHQLAGAAMLMGAMVLAIIWANSPWAHYYHDLLHMPLSVEFGGLGLSKTLHHWINDGLMGIFFFLVGLEIKRELLMGELSTARKAALPAIAAVGGMVVPALIYFAMNPSGESAAGWGIPMATDIAFALGVLALLGDRVPISLKVFLTALAIVDDLGAVLVIALFYTDEILVTSLVAGLLFFGLAIGLNRLHVRSPIAFLILGVLSWLAFLNSGVHATIAALLMALTIPSRTRIDGASLLERIKAFQTNLAKAGAPTGAEANSNTQQHLIDRMSETLNDASAPLQRIEHALAAPVAFIVLPIFALANAGVSIGGGMGEALMSPLAMGVTLGLFLGKPVGITLFTLLAVKLRLADMPDGVRWSQIVGVGLLGGIGFTMALFVATLAFPDPRLLETAKVGILAASLLSGLVGGALLVRASSSSRPKNNVV